jgi:hypothetical protein
MGRTSGGNLKLCTFVAFALTSLASFARGQTPQPYCTAGISSNLCTAQITANRQPNVAINAGCVITVSGAPGNRQGLVFYGIDNTGFTPTSWSAQSSSFLCVKAPIQRLGATQNSGGTVGQCNGSYVIDWDAFQNANPFALGNPWVAGDEVFVQSWYRDPTAVTASNLSNAVQLTLRPSVSVPCVTPLPGMVTIPAGTFTMGSDAPGGAPYFNTLAMQPAHQVTLTYCYWMGATEVTQAQYSALMGANPSAWVGANNPVERVNWFAALN